MKLNNTQLRSNVLLLLDHLQPTTTTKKTNKESIKYIMIQTQALKIIIRNFLKA